MVREDFAHFAHFAAHEGQVLARPLPAGTVWPEVLALKLGSTELLSNTIMGVQLLAEIRNEIPIINVYFCT